VFGFYSKKITKLKLKKKTETGSNRPVSVWFGFLGQNRFGSVFLFGSVFPVWVGFFQFGFGSVFLVLGL
jgi:hypothetical protein